MLQNVLADGWLFCAVKLLVLAVSVTVLFAVFFRYGCLIYATLAADNQQLRT